MITPECKRCSLLCDAAYTDCFNAATALHNRIDDYLAFGVPFVWLIKLVSRRGWVYTKETIKEAKGRSMRTSNPDIEVPLIELIDRD
jgi:hypothetical protein